MTKPKNRTEAERLLRAAAKKRDDGNAALNEAVITTADLIPRRRAGELINRSDARVQQIVNEGRAKMGVK